MTPQQDVINRMAEFLEINKVALTELSHTFYLLKTEFDGVFTTEPTSLLEIRKLETELAKVIAEKDALLVKII